MILNLDFKKIENQWRERELDLFPWFDGLFALLRSEEAILRETEKKLSNSSAATKVQFLSSDDKNNVMIARKTIGQEEPESVIPILLFSIEKVDKKGYLDNIMLTLLDFDPIISLGYLIGYLNLKTDLKGKIFQIFSSIFLNINELYSNLEKIEIFLNQLFYALKEDIKERTPPLKILNSIDDFNRVSTDLELMRMIFKKNISSDYIEIIEKNIQDLGGSVIITLRKISSEFKKSGSYTNQFLDIIEYIALMRLKADRPFILNLTKGIDHPDILEDEKTEIIEKAEIALKLIDNPEESVNELLKDFTIDQLF